MAWGGDLILPIEVVLPEIAAALEAGTRAVLVAPPGAGKTTRVPLALLDAPWRGDGTILVLEPRRIAARAAATRMAANLGEALGKRVGLRARFDSQSSASTRILVVTEGVFTRMVLDDPALTGIAAVLFDEFHERSLDADFGLALALEVQGALRPDLRLLIMSATLDDARITTLLGDAPLIRSEGRAFPVETRYRGRNPNARIEEEIASAIRAALRSEDGSILAFLPGQGEITRVASLLAEGGLPPDVDLCPLYGALDGKAQDAAISPAPSGRRKVVLSTSLAETSITIEGVRIVVDSGLARVPRYEPDIGVTRLETVRASRASVDQRRGRAGRTAPGIAIRLWDEAQDQGLIAFNRPEILDSDLAGFLLDCAAWGTREPATLPLLDPPPRAALEEAGKMLQEIGAIWVEKSIVPPSPLLSPTPLFPPTPNPSPPQSGGRGIPPAPLFPKAQNLKAGVSPSPHNSGGEGLGVGGNTKRQTSEADFLPNKNWQITPKGHALRQLPLPPRLGALVLEGASRGMAGEAAQLALLLSERGIGGTSLDLAARLERFTADRAPRAAQARAMAARWAKMAAERQKMEYPPLSPAGLLALTFPDRVAKSRGDAAFHLANGRMAHLEPHEALAREGFLVVAEMTGKAARARILSAIAISRAEVEASLADRLVVQDETRFDASARALRRRRIQKLGAITLEASTLPVDANEEAASLLAEGIASLGIASLPWSKVQKQRLARIRFLREAGEADWPDMTEAALAATVETWLAPFLLGKTRADEVNAETLGAALDILLPYALQKRLEEAAPTHFIAPTGNAHAIEYEGEGAPRLAIRVQELYGLTAHPALAGGKLPLTLELLSPAHRPIQITRDLPGFWVGSWAEVRRDLRGRYPRHVWPEDPANAAPTARAKPRGT